jgi:CRISPR-associated protein Csm4
LELHEITIRPLGGIGTPFRGDTIFGHFCWQLAYDSTLVQGGLETNLKTYGESPFVVFSSGLPRFEWQPGSPVYAMKRPDLPLSWLFPVPDEDREKGIRERKKNKARKWMLVDSDLKLDASGAVYLNDSDLLERIDNQSPDSIVDQERPRITSRQAQVHNTINRITGTTGTDEFAPYSQEVTHYHPLVTLAVFALLDSERTDISAVTTGLERIGKQGFGKDASIGLGRFSLVDSRSLEFPDAVDCSALYCMAPSVPVPGSFTEAYFLPFVRFGKHGDRLACSGNPFKNPVIMADEGAVFVPEDSMALARPYWGRAVEDVSLARPETVVQGYSICLPIKVDAGGET